MKQTQTIPNLHIFAILWSNLFLQFYTVTTIGGITVLSNIKRVVVGRPVYKSTIEPNILQDQIEFHKMFLMISIYDRKYLVKLLRHKVEEI